MPGDAEWIDMNSPVVVMHAHIAAVDSRGHVRQRHLGIEELGGGNLEPRVVETGPQLDDSVVVLNGLKAGERVVSSANFLVDSEAQLQAAMGAFASPAPQPAAGAAPATQIQIDLSTEPSPPRKGANTVRVKLTGPTESRSREHR